MPEISVRVLFEGILRYFKGRFRCKLLQFLMRSISYKNTIAWVRMRGREGVGANVAAKRHPQDGAALQVGMGV